MLNNSDEQISGTEMVAGMPVYDLYGDKVGEVTAPPGEEGYYFIVEKGWLFIHHLYIPLSAVHTQDRMGVYLKVSNHDLQDERWKSPPRGGSTVEAASPPDTSQVRDDSGPNPPIDPGALGSPPPETEPPLAQH